MNALKDLDEKTKKLLIAIVVICSLAFIDFYFDYYIKDVHKIDQYVENEKIHIVLDKEGKVSTDDVNWVRTDENNTCVLDYVEKIDELYIANKYGHVSSVENDLNFSYVLDVSIDSGNVYLAVGGKEQVTYSYEVKGTISDKPVLKSNDEKVATVDEAGVVHGVAPGKTTIEAVLGDKSDTVDVLVTDMIITMPAEYDMNKPKLGCGYYTKEENDLLDEILASRIEKAGIRTRAAVVAAARFICLEFPYHINYFLENGRIDSYVNRFCDGEGRYYHVGMYLHPSRYENIDLNMTLGGPVEWGCPLYEYSNSRWSTNGLDCSGFVSWAVRQAGFDCRDLGSGIAHEWPDLTDLGTKIWLPDVLKNDTLRTGDLLAGGEGGPTDGGHIAIVAGIDSEGYIYVAEELNSAAYWGLFIRKYDKAKLQHYFYWQVEMSDYYEGDGNLTDYWYEE